MEEFDITKTILHNRQGKHRYTMLTIKEAQVKPTLYASFI